MECTNSEYYKNNNLDPKQIYTCDKCMKNHCKLFTNLSTTEIRVLELNNRRLRYHCIDCCQVLNQADKVVKTNLLLIEENNKSY